ncbi:hypothetical protein ACL03H_11200 [Saccharopolyspora sp. MS10]|uniref:hypothetical protein n=1 Tax=Saccharopolyspora sp. MS10 TaxID=3385973 RepID=UPI0039A2050C
MEQAEPARPEPMVSTLPPDAAIPAQDRRPPPVRPRVIDLDDNDESHLVRGYD